VVVWWREEGGGRREILLPRVRVICSRRGAPMECKSFDNLRSRDFTQRSWTNAEQVGGDRLGSWCSWVTTTKSI